MYIFVIDSSRQQSAKQVLPTVHDHWPLLATACYGSMSDKCVADKLVCISLVYPAACFPLFRCHRWRTVFDWWQQTADLRLATWDPVSVVIVDSSVIRIIVQTTPRNLSRLTPDSPVYTGNVVASWSVWSAALLAGQSPLLWICCVNCPAQHEGRVCVCV